MRSLTLHSSFPHLHRPLKVGVTSFVALATHSIPLIIASSTKIISKGRRRVIDSDSDEDDSLPKPTTSSKAIELAGKPAATLKATDPGQRRVIDSDSEDGDEPVSASSASTPQDDEFDSSFSPNRQFQLFVDPRTGDLSVMHEITTTDDIREEDDESPTRQPPSIGGTKIMSVRTELDEDQEFRLETEKLGLDASPLPPPPRQGTHMLGFYE